MKRLQNEDKVCSVSPIKNYLSDENTLKNSKINAFNTMLVLFLGFSGAHMFYAEQLFVKFQVPKLDSFLKMLEKWFFDTLKLNEQTIV